MYIPMQYVLFISILLLVCMVVPSLSLPGGYMYVVKETWDVAPNIDTWTLSSVSSVDDSPFQKVDLDFDFPWFGHLKHNVHISPNGGLHFNSLPPCCTALYCTFSMSGFPNTCNFDTSYTNLIAGAITDLNPRDYGSIYFSQTTTQLEVFYDHVRFYYSYSQTDLRDLTFKISIYPSGIIKVTYYDIIDPEFVADWSGTSERLYLVGLRQLEGDEFVDNQNDYDTFVNGTYPPRDLIQSGSSVIYYPINKETCISPSIGDPSIDNDVIISFDVFDDSILSSSVWECGYELYSNNNPVAAKVLYPGIYDDNAKQLSCTVPSSVTLNTQVSPAAAYGMKVHVTVIIDGYTIPVNDIIYDYVDFSTYSSDYTTRTDIEIYCDECASWIAYTNGYRYETNQYNTSIYTNNEIILLESEREATYYNDICIKDCSGTWNGFAILDDCGVCSSGNTLHLKNSDMDCEEICFGPFVHDNSSYSGCSCYGKECLNIVNQKEGGLYNSGIQYIYNIDNNINNIDNNFNINSTEWYKWKPTNIDYPLLVQSLPFDFPFPIKTYNIIYINSNGAIHFNSPSSTCSEYGYSSLFNNNTNCNHILIAAWLTELDATTSEIMTKSDISTFTIRYNDVSLYNNTKTVTSEIVLHSNGQIDIKLINVFDPLLFPYSRNIYNTRTLVSGIVTNTIDINTFAWPSNVPSYGQEITYNNNNNNNNDVLNEYWFQNVNMNIPNNHYISIPHRNDLNNNTIIQYCPFPVSLCMSPKIVMPSGGQLIRIVTSMKSLLDVCNLNNSTLYNISCNFNGNFVPTMYNITEELYTCYAPSGTPKTAITVTLAITDKNNNIYNIPSNRLFLSYAETNSTIENTNSPWYEDYCNNCVNFEPDFCIQDCAGAWRGDAYLDDCNVCSGGTSSHVANSNKDCEGICFGKFNYYTNESNYCVCLEENPKACGDDIVAEKSNNRNYIYTLQNSIIDDNILFNKKPIINHHNNNNNNNNQRNLLGVTDGVWTDVDFNSNNNNNIISSRIELDFTFYYYNMPFRHIYISEDGVIYLESSLSDYCIINGSQALFDSLNSSDASSSSSQEECSFVSIMGYLTDFKKTEYSSIKYMSSDTYIRINYYNMSLIYNDDYVFSGNEPLYSFEMDLFSTYNSIIVRYYDVSNPKGISGWRYNDNNDILYKERNLAVGIYENFQTTGSSSSSSSALFSTSLSQSINNGNTAEFCLTGDIICIAPSEGASMGGNTIYITGEGINNLGGCNSITFGCYFSHTVFVPSTYDDVTGLFTCIVPPAELNLQNQIHTIDLSFVREDTFEPMHINRWVYTYNPSIIGSISVDESMNNLCSQCGLFLQDSSTCIQDCAGVWGGNHKVDKCNLCIDVVGYEDVTDCNGLCYGPFVPEWMLRYDGGDQCACAIADYPTMCEFYMKAPGPLSVLDTLSGLQIAQSIILTIGVCVCCIYWVHKRMSSDRGIVQQGIEMDDLNE